MPLRLVFLGPPASGKGTQGRRIAEEHHLVYLSTGALLRQAVRDGTDLGAAARESLDRGEYVPDEVMIPLVLAWVRQQKGGWLLDGFPRSVPQANALLAELGQDKVVAMILEVSDEELRRRVACRLECVVCHRVETEGSGVICPSCGGELQARADDSAGRFENRLAEYREKVLPLVPFFQSFGLARIVDGHGTPDEVFARVRQHVAEIRRS